MGHRRAAATSSNLARTSGFNRTPVEIFSSLETFRRFGIVLAIDTGFRY